MSRDETQEPEVLPGPPMQPQPPELPRTSERDGAAIEVPHGAALSRFTEAQRRCLRQAIPLEELEILPSGEIYASQVRYRRILCDAFGPGGWSLLPLTGYFRTSNSLCREYALYVNGKYISQAMGEADYYPNSRQTWATVAESLKSNALTRCCKDLCVASECWDKRFCEVFQEEHCVRVVVLRDDRGRPKKEVQWRRKDGKPLKNELGLAEDIPRGGIVQQPKALPQSTTTHDADEDWPGPDIPDPPDEPAAPPSLISRDQQRRLFAIAREGVGEVALREYVHGRLGLKSTSDIPRGQVYDELCLWAATRGANG